MSYLRHDECVVHVSAAPDALFAYLDNHEALAGHMMRSSAMMAGSAMHFGFDDAKGRAVGAKITMNGRVLGLRLGLVETVTERQPPSSKAWETDAAPRLLVIGAYRMGFTIAADNQGARLTVFIDYSLPAWPWRLLGLVAGGLYARWCVRSMARDAQGHFGG